MDEGKVGTAGAEAASTTHTQNLPGLHDGRIGTNPVVHRVLHVFVRLVLVHGALLAIGHHLVGCGYVSHVARLRLVNAQQAAGLGAI